MRFISSSYGTELIPLFPQSRSVKTGVGNNVDIAPGNLLLVTDHGLTGFPYLTGGYFGLAFATPPPRVERFLALML